MHQPNAHLRMHRIAHNADTGSKNSSQDTDVWQFLIYQGGPGSHQNQTNYSHAPKQLHCSNLVCFPSASDKQECIYHRHTANTTI
jgi:hypothetical protein